MLGKHDETRQILNRLLALARKYPVSPGLIALVYFALDEREQALTWLEKAYAAALIDDDVAEDRSAF